MNIIAFDTETELIRPGCQAPPLVCLQWQILGEDAQVIHHSNDSLLTMVTYWLMDLDTLLVGHNVAYDMCVLAAWNPALLPLIWEAYEKGRITCTLLREQLLNNQQGWLKSRPGHDGSWIKQGYSLGDLTRKYLGYSLDKPGTVMGANGQSLPDPSHVRLRYVELMNVPNIAEWPEEFVVYAKKDAEATLAVYLAQGTDYVPDEFAQAHSDFALKLMSSWGMRTTKQGIRALEADTLSAHQQCKEELQREGLIRADGTRNIKAAQAWLEQVCTEIGTEIPRTKPSASHPNGQISLSADSLEKLDDPILTSYMDFTILNSVVSKDIPMLRAGVDLPIHCRYGFAASGRTTCSKPNLQNLRTMAGIREAFSPRVGNLFLATDYAALELHTLAQVCYDVLGYSALGDALNEGRDPHTEIAARILGVNYHEALHLKTQDTEENGKPFYKARQTGKAANFGFPGGLGIRTFVASARAMYGVVLTPGEANELKRAYFSAWPEMKEYFQWIDKHKGIDGFIRLDQIGSKRIRGGMFFPAACNTMFQGLGADCAKAGLRAITHACYIDTNSVLFGCRPVCLIHDEIITEIPDDNLVHERAKEHDRLMCLGADTYVPKCPTKCETVAMSVWAKGAKQIYDDNNRLISWRQ